MGYNTEFIGEIFVEPTMTEEMIDFLDRFSRSRRMKRDSDKIEQLCNGNGLKYCLDGMPGVEGEFYAPPESESFRDESLLDNNKPPKTQPGLWCNFVPGDDGNIIEWNEVEKTYNAELWIKYIVQEILAPKGYKCHGNIECHGESYDDFWGIDVIDNEVFIYDMKLVKDKDSIEQI